MWGYYKYLMPDADPQSIPSTLKSNTPVARATNWLNSKRYKIIILYYNKSYLNIVNRTSWKNQTSGD